MQYKFPVAAAHVMVALAYVIFGFTFFFTDTILKTTTVVDLLAMRFLIGAVVFVLLWVTRVIKIHFHRNFLWVFLTALFEPVLYYIFETVGIKYTTTMVSGMIIAFSPMFVVLLENIILKEKTTTQQKLFLLLSVAGVMFVSVMGGSDGTNSVLGIICMFLAATFSSFFIVGSRRAARTYTSIEVTFYCTIIGAIAFNGISFVQHVLSGTVSTYFAPLTDPITLLCLLGLSVLSSIGAMLMLNYGLSKVQASVVSVYSGLTPITTIIVGVLFNNEQLYLYHMIATVMILVGVIGINKTKSKL